MPYTVRHDVRCSSSPTTPLHADLLTMHVTMQGGSGPQESGSRPTGLAGPARSGSLATRPCARPALAARQPTAAIIDHHHHHPRTHAASRRSLRAASARTASVQETHGSFLDAMLGYFNLRWRHHPADPAWSLMEYKSRLTVAEERGLWHNLDRYCGTPCIRSVFPPAHCCRHLHATGLLLGGITHPDPDTCSKIPRRLAWRTMASEHKRKRLYVVKTYLFECCRSYFRAPPTTNGSALVTGGPLDSRVVQKGKGWEKFPTYESRTPMPRRTSTGPVD